MNRQERTDQRFDANLASIAKGVDVPPTAGSSIMRRCDEALVSRQAPVASKRQGHGFAGRIWMSTLGVAASIALVVSVVIPWGHAPRVEAAMVLAKLNEQIAATQRIEIVLESIVADEASIDGEIHASRDALSGSVHVVADTGDGAIDVDIAFGISSEEKWVLIRKLVVEDAQMAAMLNLFFPPGSETLVLLPDDGEQFGLDLGDELRIDGLFDVIKEVAEALSDVGAEVREQADGTVLVVLPLKDHEAIESLSDAMMGMVEDMGGIDGSSEQPGGNGGMEISLGFGAKDGGLRIRTRVMEDSGEVDSTIEVSEAVESEPSDIDELLGSTVRVVFDPATEEVRSFEIVDLGDKQGAIRVMIHDGAIDPALLSSDSVSTPSTRTLDLDAIMSIFSEGDDGEE